MLQEGAFAGGSDAGDVVEGGQAHGLGPLGAVGADGPAVGLVPQALDEVEDGVVALQGEGAFAGRTPVTLYVGVPMPERRSLLRRDGELWCFGACAAPLAYETHGQAPAAHCVPGCPPHILDFYKAYKARYGNSA